MKDWQVRLQLQAQAILVRVAGMEAENQYRVLIGERMLYIENDFNQLADEIEQLGREIGDG